jgi:CDP-paratose 2-epimerase
LDGKPITIYGNGFQVRDVLHVYDLVEAMNTAKRNMAKTSGEIYNLGGGMERAVSVTEMLRSIATETGINPSLHYRDIRPGDQPLYISNTEKLAAHTGWRPRFSNRETLQAIHHFWKDNRNLFEHMSNVVVAPELVGQEVA